MKRTDKTDKTAPKPITKQQIAEELKRRVVNKGATEEERKKKAEWFRKHVEII